MKTLIRINIFIFIFLILFSTDCKRSFVGANQDPGLSSFTRFQQDSLTLASLRKVDDYPLYIMTYYGDYGFDVYLKTGQWPAISAINRETGQFACTCFAAMNEDGDKILGRNFDWRNRASLLLFTDPPDAYASVSMVDLAYFGFPNNTNLASETDQNALKPLLMTPYLPFDGMNEHGLAIGMMAVSHAEPPYDPDKITIGEIEVIRLALDYARNVDEAVSLIGKYNVRMDNPPIHYLLADKTGQSIIIEFVNKNMKILRNAGPWQVSTNFVFHDYESPESAGCWRYNLVWKSLQDNNGLLTADNAMDVLENVSQTNTMWSMVYNMSNGDIFASTGRQYEHVHRFSFNKK